MHCKTICDVSELCDLGQVTLPLWISFLLPSMRGLDKITSRDLSSHKMLSCGCFAEVKCLCLISEI